MLFYVGSVDLTLSLAAINNVNFEHKPTFEFSI